MLETLSSRPGIPATAFTSSPRGRYDRFYTPQTRRYERTPSGPPFLYLVYNVRAALCCVLERGRWCSAACFVGGTGLLVSLMMMTVVTAVMIVILIG